MGRTGNNMQDQENNVSSGVDGYTGGQLDTNAAAAAFWSSLSMAGATASGETVRRSPITTTRRFRATPAMRADPWDPIPDVYTEVEVPHTPVVPLQDFQDEFWDRWDDEGFRVWLTTRLVRAGLVGADPTVAQVQSAWDKIGAKAASSPGWKGTPEQLLEFFATGSRPSAEDVDAAIAAGQAAVDPVTGGAVDVELGLAREPTTTTSKAYQSISREQAGAVADAALRAALGREASAAEVKRFRAKIQAAFDANPSVTTTTTDQWGNSTRRSSGGDVSAAAIAEDMADGEQFTKERRRYAAAGYLDRLIAEVRPVI